MVSAAPHFFGGMSYLFQDIFHQVGQTFHSKGSHDWHLQFDFHILILAHSPKKETFHGRWQIEPPSTPLRGFINSRGSHESKSDLRSILRCSSYILYDVWLRLVDENWLERDLSTLLLRTLVVCRRQHSSKIRVDRGCSRYGVRRFDGPF